MPSKWDSLLDQPDSAAQQSAPQTAAPTNPWDSFLNENDPNYQAPAPDAPGGIWQALKGGTAQTASSLRTAFNIYTGDNAEVVELASRQPAEKTDAQDRFMEAIQAGISEGDEGLWDGLQNVASAAWQNPQGAFHEMIAQLPNSAAVLGSGATGFTIGGAIGGPFAPITSVAGGIIGMLAGNTAIETGFLGQERAADEEFTEAERAQTMRQGFVKGGVITAIDTATMGLTRAIAGAPGRVVERAIAKSLTDNGVDVASDVAVRKALSDPTVLQTVTQAGSMALARTMASSKPLGRSLTSFSLESISEGAGEYMGSVAAGLEASPTDAVMESLLSIPQSMIELRISKSLRDRGRLTKTVGDMGGDISAAENVMAAPDTDSAIDEAMASVEQPIPDPAEEAAFEQFSDELKTAANDAVAGGADIEEVMDIIDAATAAADADPSAIPGAIETLGGMAPEIETLDEVVDPALQAQPAAQAEVSEYVEKAQTDFDTYVGGRDHDDIEAAIRENVGDEAADEYRAEVTRLTAEAVTKRLAEAKAPRETEEVADAPPDELDGLSDQDIEDIYDLAASEEEAEVVAPLDKETFDPAADTVSDFLGRMTPAAIEQTFDSLPQNQKLVSKDLTYEDKLTYLESLEDFPEEFKTGFDPASTQVETMFQPTAEPAEVPEVAAVPEAEVAPADIANEFKTPGELMSFFQKYDERYDLRGRFDYPRYAKEGETYQFLQKGTQTPLTDEELRKAVNLTDEEIKGINAEREVARKQADAVVETQRAKSQEKRVNQVKRYRRQTIVYAHPKKKDFFTDSDKARVKQERWGLTNTHYIDEVKKGQFVLKRSPDVSKELKNWQATWGVLDRFLENRMVTYMKPPPDFSQEAQAILRGNLPKGVTYTQATQADVDKADKSSPARWLAGDAPIVAGDAVYRFNDPDQVTAFRKVLEDMAKPVSQKLKELKDEFPGIYGEQLTSVDTEEKAAAEKKPAEEVEVKKEETKKPAKKAKPKEVDQEAKRVEEDRRDTAVNQTPAPRWSATVLQSALHNDVLDSVVVTNSFKAGPLKHAETLREQLLKEIEKRRSEAVRNKAQNEVEAYDQLLADGDLDPGLFGPGYFDSAYKETLKSIEKDKRAKQKARWVEASREQLDVEATEYSENRDKRQAFIWGWEHATGGGTASNLPTGNLHSENDLEALKAGYNQATEFMKEKGGPGKRGAKMARTGVILRRMMDLKWNREATGDAVNEEIKKAYNAIFKTVTRADAFANKLAEKATPGAVRAFEFLRNEQQTPTGYAAAAIGKKIGRSLAHRVTKIPRALKSYLVVGADVFGIYQDPFKQAANEGWADRIDELRETLEDYVKAMDKASDLYAGVTTVEQVIDRYIKQTLAARDTTDIKRLSYQEEAVIRKLRKFEAGEEKQAEVKGKAKPLRRPKFDRVEREGLPDYRGGKNISLEELKKAFGLGDIHPGNYVTATQLQDHSNYAYDTLMDYARILGWKPSQMGFKGRLHLAFGALGSGRFSAHYQNVQPISDAQGNLTGESVPVINLTNTKGDGSVAHEYIHAIDYFLLRGKSTPDAGQESAIREVVNLLKHNLLDTDGVQTAVNKFLYAGWLYKGKTSLGKTGMARYHVDRILSDIGDMYTGRSLGRFPQVTSGQTSYYREALKMGRDYWANNLELLARAGEAYIYDSLKAEEKANNYLVSSWVEDGVASKANGYKGSPYPSGDERGRFGELFEMLFDNLEIDSEGYPVVNKKFTEELATKFYGPLEEAAKAARETIPKTDAALKEITDKDKAAVDEAREVAAQAEATELKAQLTEEFGGDTGKPASVADLSDEDIEDIFDEAAAEVSDSSQEETDMDALSGHNKLVDSLYDRFDTDASAMDWRELFGYADAAYNGTQAEGAYTPKDAYDALEVAVNKTLLYTDFAEDHINNDVEEAQQALDNINEMLILLPTQSKRTEEMDEYQQFSTPPTIGYVMARAANITRRDIVAEPSAGTGSLATPTIGFKPKSLILNELSERRAALLADIDFGIPSKLYREDASHLDDILPKEEVPTVIVMNPPFSATAGRITGKRDNAVGANHVMAALKRLAEGGRAVILLGEGMNMEGSYAKGFWETVQKEYTIRANIALSGKSYQKYGTTFDNQLVVIDKIGPQIGDTLTASFKEKFALENLKKAIALLEDTRNERTHPGKQFSPEPGREETAGRGSRSDDVVQFAAGERTDQPDRTGSGVESTRAAEPEGGDGDPTGRERAGPGRAEPVGGEPGATRTDPGDHGKRLGDIIAEAGKHGVSGASEALTGLHELFGGKSVKSFPSGFSEADYEAAKPHFQKSWDEFKAAGRSIKEFFQFLIRNFGPGIKPYAVQFVKDIRDSGSPGLADTPAAVETDQAEASLIRAEVAAETEALTDAVFDTYTPSVSIAGAQPHPGTLVESAAMSSVNAPDTNYAPTLPPKAITSGALSDAQIEQVIRAGDAHSRVTKEGLRRGYFIGDGTGLGKAREVVGIMLDNIANGRKRHIWISKDDGKLYTQALADWKSVSGKDATNLIHRLPTKANDKIDLKEGIIFVSYGKLRQMDKQQGGRKTRSRVDQIKDWMGEDFDGVIAFDESHKMGNAVVTKGKRGKTKPSTTALQGISLQEYAKDARMLYVSATGATEVTNLGYATRLGLWGEGTSFSGVEDFVAKINEKGVAAMELVAQDMKAMGSYLARSLSYHDVTYGQLQHNLTDDQEQMYNTMAQSWNIIQKNVEAALVTTNAESSGNAKGAARAAFWGAHQRFFNQILTALQMPSLLTDIEEKIANGDAVVLQLVNTNEAQTERAAAAAASENISLDDLDITPRQMIMQFLENSFPTTLYEEYEDDKGNIKARPVLDSKGDPVVSSEAVAMREKLLDEVALITIPQGPLDQLVSHFGRTKVAEATGRSRRLIEGEKGKKWEKRGPNAVAADISNFMTDKKQILVFSGAAGTGVDFHADLRVKNQRKRYHYLVQPGWRADEAVQGFGRTHRSNQAQAPHYTLVTTNIKGHLRFISSVAKRLDQLGALTKGQRETGSQGIFSAEHNLENRYASEAMYGIVRDLSQGKSIIENFDIGVFETELGFDIRNSEGQINPSKAPTVPQFLNRILALPVARQNFVFDVFFNRLQEVVDYHKEQGDYDLGIANIQALSTEKTDEQVVHKDAESGAETKYVQLKLEQPVHVMKFTEFLDLAERRGKVSEILYAKNNRSGAMAAFIPTVDKTKPDGTVVAQLRRYGPTTNQSVEKSSILKRWGLMAEVQLQGNWEKIEDPLEAARLWQEEFDQAPKTKAQEAHLITGAILPIFDRLPQDHTIKVVRAQTDAGERFIGLQLSNRDVAPTLAKLGADVKSKYTAKQVQDLLLKEKRNITLANGWGMYVRKVSGEDRIELYVPPRDKQGWQNRLRDWGILFERIDYQMRLFVPTNNLAVLQRLIDQSPVISTLDPDADETSLFHGNTKPVGTGIGAKGVREAVQATIEQWKNGPQVNIVESAADLSEADQRQIEAFQGQVSGVMSRSSGQIYLLGDNISSSEHAMQVLSHEVIGHFAFDKVYGAELKEIYESIDFSIAKDPALKKIYDEVMETYADAPKAVQSAEIVARIAEAGLSHPALMKIWAWIRKVLRSMGIDIVWGKEDIRAMLLTASDALRKGFNETPSTHAFAREMGTAPAFAGISGDALRDNLAMEQAVIDIANNPAMWSQYGLGNEREYFYQNYEDRAVKVRESVNDGNIPMERWKQFVEPEVRLFSERELTEYQFAIDQDLDMSTEARMERAKKQGFDTETVYYHGTRVQGGFTQYRPGAGGSIFFSPSPEIASLFASSRLSTYFPGHVVPVLVKRGRIFDGSNMSAEEEKALEGTLRGIIAYERDRELYDQRKPKLTPVQLATEVSQVMDGIKSLAWSAIEDPEVQMAIRALGYDGFYVRETFKDGPADPISDQRNISLYNMNSVRSVNAAFSYEYQDHDNLLFSAIPKKSAYAEENRRIREEDQTLWRKAKTMLRRQLTPAGLLPKDVFDAKVKRDAEFGVLEMQTQHLVGLFEKALKKDFKKSIHHLSQADRKMLSDGLAGNLSDKVQGETRKVLIAMRQDIDNWSEQYREVLRNLIEEQTLGFDEAENLLMEAYLKSWEVEATGKTRVEKAMATRARNKIMLDAKIEAKKILGGKGLKAALSRAGEAAVQVGRYRNIGNNMGSYVHRSYQAFDDKNWYKKVSDDVLDNAREFLVERIMDSGAENELGGMTEEEAAARARVIMEDILKNGTAYENFMGYIKESKLGAKDLSILKRRKEIAPEIRALLGEYDDPRVNYAKSIGKMGRLIWNQRFLDKFREVGMGEFLFTEENRPPNTIQIASDGSEVYSPLDGLWTYREVNQGMIDALGKDRSDGWLRAIIQANAYVKIGKTVGAPTTAMRNWYSALFFTIANGHFNLLHASKSVSGIREYFSQMGEGEKLEYLKELKRRGVVYDSPYAGEMMRLVQDAGWDNTFRGSATKEKMSNFFGGIKKFYQYGDDFWKIIGYENEWRQLKKHGFAEEEAKNEAAKRIRNTYPTYTLVGRGIKQLARFPLAGTFVSFPAEIIRTTGNMFRYLYRDAKDPRTRPMAYRRAAGMAIAAGFAHALQAISKAMFDIDDDDEEAIRLQAAPWNENSNLWFQGRNEQGEIQFLDISYTDPYNLWKRPINAILRNQPWEKKLADVARDAFSPFFGTDIAAGAIFESLSNKRLDTGTEIYKENDKPADQVWDIFNHLRKSIQPGVASNMERTWKALQGETTRSGRQYKLADEAWAWAGWRVTTLDPKMALYYRSFDFSDAKTDATRTLNEVLQNPNEVSDDAIGDAYRIAQTIRTKAYGDMAKMVVAARRSGVARSQVISTLKSSGMSQADILAIMNDKIPRWRLSRQSERNAVRRARGLIGRDTGQIIRSRYRAARDVIRRNRPRQNQ